MNPTIVKKLFFISLICAILSATVMAQGRVISQAYEILLNNFQAPASAASTVGFKECEECEQMYVRVTEATRYSINGQPIRLEEFRLALLQASDPENIAVTVLHHLESNTVESIDASI